MQSWQTPAAGVSIGILVIALLAFWWLHRVNRTKQLRMRFGPEYDRRIAALGSRRLAEKELARSEARVQRLKFRPLSDSDRNMFIDAWRLCQSQFVDDPAAAVDGADRIVTDIMRKRGYAANSHHDRYADVFAAYPHHAASYHEAHEIALRRRGGYASTRDLRKAFVSLRSLFDEMLSEPDEGDRKKRAS